MPPAYLLVIFGLCSFACAVSAAKLAVRQGRNPTVWAALTFVLPALLLFLMKFQVEQDKQ